ncbi:MAG: MaoC family dehydratase [Ardenticatenaceae bacterium]|nr:MaoC family dehydratase [Ardenticatenaceae bacterium]
MRTNKDSSASDETKKRTSYDEIEVGTEFTSKEWVITPEQVDYFCEGNEDYHEWYSLDSPFGGRIAPPLINYRPARDLFSARYTVRGLLAEYESDYINPVKPNKKMVVAGKITGKWMKRDKAFVEYEVTCVDEDGLEIFRTKRVHLLDRESTTTS